MKISWLILTYDFIQIHVQVDQVWVRNESSDSHQSEGFVLQCGWESLFGWWICLRLCGWRTLAQDVSIHNVKKSRMVRKSDANCHSLLAYTMGRFVKILYFFVLPIRHPGVQSFTFYGEQKNSCFITGNVIETRRVLKIDDTFVICGEIC